MSKDFVQIGNLKKTFGNNGDISFRLFNENDVILQAGDAIFLYLDGIYVPFFLSEVSLGKKSVLHLDDVDNLKEAEDLSGNAVFLRKEQIENEINPSDSLEYGFLEGYVLKDQENNELGLIKEILSYPMQEMAVIRNNVLIPLNERLIIDIDSDKKEIQYQIIDGLLD